MGLLERYKGPSTPPFHRLVGCCGSQDTTGRQAILNPAGFASLSLFLSLLTAILQGIIKNGYHEKTFAIQAITSERRIIE